MLNPSREEENSELSSSQDLTDNRHLANIRWLFENFPEMFQGITAQALKPDDVPEHRVILQCIQTRDKARGPLRDGT